MSECDTTSRPPNVVLVLTDDQGWGDLSRTGNTNLSTPCIDALAANGATFDSFYVQPLCAPTRAEILTGRYFPRTGVRGVTRRRDGSASAWLSLSAGWARGLRPELTFFIINQGADCGISVDAVQLETGTEPSAYEPRKQQ